MGMRLRVLISTRIVSRVVTSKVERSRPHTRCLWGRAQTVPPGLCFL